VEDLEENIGDDDSGVMLLCLLRGILITTKYFCIHKKHPHRKIIIITNDKEIQQ
jgi:hypothetical protein